MDMAKHRMLRGVALPLQEARFKIFLDNQSGKEDSSCVISLWSSLFAIEFPNHDHRSA